MPVLKMKPTPGGNGGTTVVANPELAGDEPNLTGIEIEGAKYKVPEGGSGGGNDSFFSITEFANYVNGKVLDVDKTVELFDEIIEELGYTEDEYYLIKIALPGFTDSEKPILGFYDNSSYFLSVCGFIFDQDEISSRADLISAKETIEATPINNINMSSDMIYPFVIQANFSTSDLSKQKIVSYERLKSLFKEYTPVNG